MWLIEKILHGVVADRKLDDGEWWPENGLLQFNTILQLMLFCHQLGKC